jgi:hypothetical protein
VGGKIPRQSGVAVSGPRSTLTAEREREPVEIGASIEYGFSIQNKSFNNRTLGTVQIPNQQHVSMLVNVV